MEYRELGRTAQQVSRICLGCMSFGNPGEGVHKWAIGEDEAKPIIKRAVDLGINFFDTANAYGNGRSEEILGRTVRDLGVRSQLVLATKVGLAIGPDSGGELSRQAINAAVDESLRRLQTDYIDLYIIHRPDRATRIEETLEALSALVDVGKVRWLGASSMPIDLFRDMIEAQLLNGWAQFAAMQNYYNLLYREDEPELIPLCQKLGIAVTPWSPLARGKLARSNEDETERSRLDPYIGSLLRPVETLDRSVLLTLRAAAARRGMSPARLALAWLLNKPGVVAPVLGTTSLEQLEDGCAATGVVLSPSEIGELEESYLPHSAALTDLYVKRW